ncbi:MAG: GIY-YIG nuclease family protein [Alphaproteobacteria bacterium]|nr:GIY-YIG nuclease family protein [Alphaproteobacteria bacterium]
MPFYVYILASKRNGTLYVGMTNDLIRRVHEHRTGAADGFTKKYGVKTLVYFEDAETAAVAIKREKRLKDWPRAWKKRAIERENPLWRDLYGDITT